MKELVDMIKEVQSLPERMNKAFEETLRKYEHIVVEYVSVDQQFEKGQDGRGRSLGSYSPTTILIKRGKGQPTDRITLEDTGAFHEGFYIEFSPEGFSIRSSNNMKEGTDLIKYWGEDIMEINEENLSDLMENYVIPEISKLI